MKKWSTVFAVVIMIMMMTPTVVQADYQTDRITLYYDRYHYEVQNLQQDLRNLGYYKYDKITQHFGIMTNDAVIRFQRDYGLTTDGIVGPQTSRAIKRARINQTAYLLTGIPYQWGGSSPSGFDCSGFTHYVFLKNGIVIPRTAADQFEAGKWINLNQLQTGDLVFFTTYKAGPSHVGIYVGNNKFIHASSGAGKITVSDMNNSYYSQRYLGARRVIN